MAQPGAGKHQMETAGRKLKINYCGKKEETGHFPSFDLYKTKTVLPEEM
jgi:hypothetical protein